MLIPTAVPRKPRIDVGGHIYHVLNRAVHQRALFETANDYNAFEGLLSEAKEQVPMRILAYCLMPNHWHFLLWPIADGDLRRFVKWLSCTHVRRSHLARDIVGRGALYQSRFKSIPVQCDQHLYWVWRYVERNALRAGLVDRAETWPWGSLSHRARRGDLLSEGPLQLPLHWATIVNHPQTAKELSAFREHVAMGTPYGDEDFCKQGSICNKGV
jgi:putative transposase